MTGPNLSDSHDRPVDAEGIDPLTSANLRMNRLERTNLRQRAVIGSLLVVLILLGSTVVYVVTEKSATVANGEDADCRSAELAETLDDFAIYIGPKSTAADRAAAAEHLERIGPLKVRYRECSEP